MGGILCINVIKYERNNDMGFSEKLQEYARLVARQGVNVTAGKYVLLFCSIEAAEFGRMVEEECYRLGACDVIMIYKDQKASRIRLDYAPLDEYKTLPEWQAEQRNYYAREGCVTINILAEDPEAYAGASSEKLQAGALAAHKAYKEFYDIMDKGGIRWTIAAVPCVEWARKVFPGNTDAKAVSKLWESIFKTVRIGRGDTVAKWQRHDRVLKRRAKILNTANFSALRYKNSLGTNFTVGLADSHIWKGGSEKCAEGVDYFPNLPTEELFTMPDCRRADGSVYSSMPLSYQGELIENFRLDFKDGEVVSYSAEKGHGALERLLSTDDGSRRLGEVALIPCDSPIAQSGILYYNTLFDENASCHLALGECYPDTMRGGELLSEEELLARGGNRSANHVDFMIGTDDMEIVGIKKDGSEMKIFENGRFVI